MPLKSHSGASQGIGLLLLSNSSVKPTKTTTPKSRSVTGLRPAL
nr:MAG TPA: hypothetical protein [Caudoviricetes sp.]